MIVGIGEVLWDVYPGSERLGGAPANFALHVAALGAEAHLVSAVGADEPGDRALERLGASGVHVEHVARLQQRDTGRVTVRLDREKRPTYDIVEEVAWDHIPWSAALATVASRTDAVCFGTLAQRSPGSRSTIMRFLDSTRRDALRMFDVNLRQRYYDRDVVRRSMERASALKLNEEELPVVAALCGIPAGDDADTLRALARRYELRLVALTRGPRGALLVAGDEASSERAPDVEVVDTVGAGDAFTAAIVHDSLRGLPLDDINRHANEVAARVCSRASSRAATD